MQWSVFAIRGKSDVPVPAEAQDTRACEAPKLLEEPYWPRNTWVARPGTF